MFYKNNKVIPFSKIASAAIDSNMSVEHYLELADITEANDDDVTAVDKDGFNFGGKGDFDFKGVRAITPEQNKEEI